MSEFILPRAQAELLQPSNNINGDVDFFRSLGFQLNTIYPADNPAVAALSGFGIHLKLDVNSTAALAIINLQTDNPNDFDHQGMTITAPNGTIFNLVSKSYKLISPPTQHKFEVRQLKENDPWVIGRAGMLYRDLIPDRLGGSIIASHINILKGGPVPDMVHYHTVGFQLIFCYRGWVRVVYEDQGPPILLEAGDCVTQPPEIRHRVLESSDNLEVIEIGIPAEHMTTIDHELELPNKPYNPDREFQGQKFCHHQKNNAQWLPGPVLGFEQRDTGISKASNNAASVIVVQSTSANNHSPRLVHDADIQFSFLLEGSMVLEAKGNIPQQLKSGDAFVIPPDMEFQYNECSTDLELLQVFVPGDAKISSR